MAILHNSSMKAATLNRISLVLSLIGMYVAGTMSLEKLLGIEVPCGAGGGCSAVTNSAAAFWFGLPVAFIGFGGYVVLAALSAIRSSQTLTEAGGLIKTGLFVSAFGFLASVWFQYNAILVQHHFCPWCFASALLMTGLLVTHVLLNKELAKESSDRTLGTRDLLPMGGAVMLIIIALGIQGSVMKKSDGRTMELSAEQTKGVQLVPDRANIYGDPKAPVTIVEFADLCCPVCQRMGPMTREFVDKHPGKVRLVYRHFPLPMHALGNTAASMAEYAADKGRFWQFAECFNQGEEPKDPQILKDAAMAAGLDLTDMGKRLSNDKDPAYDRVQRDREAADKLGLNSTPTFIIMAPGMANQLAKGSAVFETLQSGSYDKYIGKS
ncbi:hypothetical protein BH11ARM2_BH11ARM2_18290 [soil metagenome]